ncbi:MAG: N-acetyl-gamma-glutamyl-phosphate reductase [Eubacterium sp.]|nr:N-acetyl-gamma-glutamyl-phosphate reductase [Eubacterium sp.]
MTKVFIDGQAGTTGLRIKDRLLKRDDIELLIIDEDKRKDTNEIKKFINASDITFLCLPDAAAIEAVSLLDKDNNKTKIIDASTAHRTNPNWAYGFPELSEEFKRRIQTNQLIANPGCYASGFNSIVAPLVANGVISADYPLTCFAVSGYSGAGNKAIAQYEDLNRDVELDSPRLYALTQSHKHLKEMVAISGLDNTPIFSPMICDYKCGMVVSIPLFTNMMNKKYSLNDVRDILAEHYEGKKAVKVRPVGYTENMIGANNFYGRDDMEIEVNGNDDRIVITSRFDNLGKGASGAAIQCMNLSLGIDEHKSLVIGE